MKKIVLLSIFNLLAITGFVLLIVCNLEDIIVLVLSTIGILSCGFLSIIIAVEYKLYKAEKCKDKFEKEVKKDDENKVD